MGSVILGVRDVSKVYRSARHIKHALHSVSLQINEGEIFSLLGVNGAGKTTLSSIIATLHPPTEGDVLFKGQSIYKNLIAYRAQLGFCPQRPNLDPFLNVEENLLFAGRYYLLPEKLIVERIALLLEQFSLKQYATFDVAALSGGYKQRLLIARALIHQPKIVILDEPTVGLDPDVRRQLWEIIKQLKEQGVTVILTTHYLEEAELLSDRVCILNEGKILLTAGVEELKQKHQKEKLEEVFLELMEKEKEEAENGQL